MTILEGLKYTFYIRDLCLIFIRKAELCVSFPLPESLRSLIYSAVLTPSFVFQTDSPKLYKLSTKEIGLAKLHPLNSTASRSHTYLEKRTLLLFTIQTSLDILKAEDSSIKVTDHET